MARTSLRVNPLAKEYLHTPSVLLNGRRMSPASYFIRTGRIPRGVNPKALREAVSKLGERFLSSTWYR
ncbi:MAG: hypothetical protein ABIA76_00335, partial [Candidatus Diapherotrites archaeon]